MKNVLIFLAGLAAGTVGTLVYVRKCVVPAIRDEVQREQCEQCEREHADYDYSEYYDDSEVEEGEVAEKPDPKKRRAKAEVKADPIDYTVYSKEEDEKPDPKKLQATYTVSEKTSEKYEISVDDGGFDPYVIDASEFEINPSYISHSFYYHSDGVVLDEDTGERLDGDPRLIFGDTAMRELEENGIVYVRDDAKKQEYVIELINAPYGTNIFDEPEA